MSFNVLSFQRTQCSCIRSVFQEHLHKKKQRVALFPVFKRSRLVSLIFSSKQEKCPQPVIFHDTLLFFVVIVFCFLFFLLQGQIIRCDLDTSTRGPPPFWYGGGPFVKENRTDLFWGFLWGKHIIFSFTLRKSKNNRKKNKTKKTNQKQSCGREETKQGYGLVFLAPSTSPGGVLHAASSV